MRKHGTQRRKGRKGRVESRQAVKKYERLRCEEMSVGEGECADRREASNG